MTKRSTIHRSNSSRSNADYRHSVSERKHARNLQSAIRVWKMRIDLTSSTIAALGADYHLTANLLLHYLAKVECSSVQLSMQLSAHGVYIAHYIISFGLCYSRLINLSILTVRIGYRPILLTENLRQARVTANHK